MDKLWEIQMNNYYEPARRRWTADLLQDFFQQDPFQQLFVANQDICSDQNSISPWLISQQPHNNSKLQKRVLDSIKYYSVQELPVRQQARSSMRILVQAYQSINEQIKIKKQIKTIDLALKPNLLSQNYRLDTLQVKENLQIRTASRANSLQQKQQVTIQQSLQFILKQHNQSVKNMILKHGKYQALHRKKSQNKRPSSSTKVLKPVHRMSQKKAEPDKLFCLKDLLKVYPTLQRH